MTSRITARTAGPGAIGTAARSGRVAAARCFTVAFAAALLAVAPAAHAKTKVVVSINDLGSIAARVGGNEVEVAPIARATADPHRVEVLPSYMVRVSKADLYLKVGLGLDRWADQIIDGSRNERLAVVDCSKNVAVLEKPAGPVNASMGDVHPDGNPHYWLDPRNGAVVARDIAEALGRIDPAHAAEFDARAEEFSREAHAALERGRKIAESLPSRKIITYHRSWPYFADAFGLDVAGTIEPIPGIPPTGRHLQDLVDLIRGQSVLAVLQEPYFSREAGGFLTRETGVPVLEASPSCAGTAPGDYIAHFEEVLSRLAGPKTP